MVTLSKNIEKVFDTFGIKDFSIQARKVDEDLPSNYRIVFSTDPWDIATMSMRGIKSCMEWSHKYSTGLVGSMLCPYTAVIYLTDGMEVRTLSHNKTYGKATRMLARSVVRIVNSTVRGERFDIRKNNYVVRPRLMLERNYTTTSIDQRGITNKHFIRAINLQKRKGKIAWELNPMKRSELISSDVTSDLYNLGEQEGERYMTYSDSDLYYARDFYGV